MLLVQGKHAHGQAVDPGCRQARSRPGFKRRRKEVEKMKCEEKAGWVAPQGAGGARELDDDRAPGAEFARDARLVGWLVAAVAAFALVTLTGCGSGSGERSIVDSDPAPAAKTESFGIATAMADTGVESGIVRSESPGAVPADSLPPDILASTSETDVTPGGNVEIEARVSTDVTEVFLADGIGRKQSFAWDSTASVWRAHYRVPLGVKGDRLGVAVTARNGLELSHRVWIFLRIEREAAAEPATPRPEGEEATGSGS